MDLFGDKERKKEIINTVSVPSNDNDIDGIYKYLSWNMNNSGMSSDCFHYLEVLKNNLNRLSMHDKLIEDMKKYTDLNPWYWIAYGEKSYAFAVVGAFTLNENDIYPTFGSQLTPHEDDERIWIGDNGVEMLIDEYIANIEQQNGDTICKFIAAAHTYFLSDDIKNCDDILAI